MSSIPGFDISTLANLATEVGTKVSTPSAEDKKEAKFNQTSSKNVINKFSKGMAKVLKSDIYTKATPDKQKLIREHIYDKFALPAYKKVNSHNSGAIPSKEEFATQKFETRDGDSVVDKFTIESVKNISHNVRSSLDIIHKLTGGKYIEDKLGPAEPKLGAKVPWYQKNLVHEADYYINKRTSEYLEDHMDNRLSSKVASGAASMAGDLPYFVIGEGLLASSGKLIELDKFAESGLPLAKLGSKMLHDASLGLITSLMKGDSKETTQENIKDFAVGGVALRTGGKMLSTPVKYFRRLVGLGGSKLAVDSLKSAVTHLETEEWNGGVMHGPLSPSKMLTKATAEVLNTEAVKRGFGNYTSASPGAKVQILNKVFGHIEMAGKTLTVDSKLSAMELHKDIQTGIQFNPGLKNLVSNLEKITGKPLAAELGESVAKDAKIKVRGAKAVISKVEKINNPHLGKEATRDYWEIKDPKTGGKTRGYLEDFKDEEEWKRAGIAAGAVIKPKQDFLSVGAAGKNSPVFVQNFLNKFPRVAGFETQGQRLLVLLQFPLKTQERKAVYQFLSAEFPGKTKQELLGASKVLKKHLKMVLDNQDHPDVNKWRDKVFRSTILDGKHTTQWQDALKDIDDARKGGE